MKVNFLALTFAFTFVCSQNMANAQGASPTTTPTPLSVDFRVKPPGSTDRSVSVTVEDANIGTMIIIPKKNPEDAETIADPANKWLKLPTQGKQDETETFTIVGIDRNAGGDGKKKRYSYVVSVKNGQLVAAGSSSDGGGSGPGPTKAEQKKLMLGELGLITEDFELPVKLSELSDEEKQKLANLKVTVGKLSFGTDIQMTGNEINPIQKIRIKLLTGENTLKIEAQDSSGKGLPGLALTTKIECPCNKVEISTNGVAVADLQSVGITLGLGNWSADEKSKARFMRIRVGDESEFRELERDSANGIKSVQTVPVKLKHGMNTVSIDLFRLQTDKDPINGLNAKGQIYCGNPCEPISRSRNTRLIAGFEQGGASSAVSSRNPFLDLYLRIPFSTKKKDGGKQLSFWSDIRLTSTSIQKFADLSLIAANPISTASQEGVNDVVQSFKVNVGLEWRIFNSKATSSYFIPARSSFALIAGVGATSPLTGGKDTKAQIFKIPYSNGVVNPEFRQLFLDPNNGVGIDLAGKSNIAFLQPERDRFLRRWFAGGRINHNFSRDGKPLELSPAQFDITIGQDESITRKLTGAVLTFEAFTPIPFPNTEYLFVYGGISTKMKRKAISQVPKFILNSGPEDELTDPTKTVIIPLDSNPLTLSSRDTFFFGIGVDLARIFRQARQSPNQ